MVNIEQMGFYVRNDVAAVLHCAFEAIPHVAALVEMDTQEDEEHTLDAVYEKTNTIHQEWWKNAGVLPMFTEQGCRSTSVGDIIKIGDDFWKVASFGFDKLDGVPEEWYRARRKLNVKD